MIYIHTFFFVKNIRCALLTNSLKLVLSSPDWVFKNASMPLPSN